MTDTTKKSNRIGLHYFPDTLHYREQDLQTWLPELKSLGVDWLTLIAPLERAIPEFFIQGLLESGIEPVLHLQLPVSSTTKDLQLGILFDNYARWGIRYVTLFDRPNIRRSWSTNAWAQNDLVERFLDVFIRLSDSAIHSGLIPVFPPLEPGGDYWDTAFLQSALHSIQRRGKPELVKNMALGVYAWTYDRSLDWGKGGPERWPSAQPYFTPTGSQDQIGFYIFDWYQAIARAEFGHPLPLLLLRSGTNLSNLGTTQIDLDMQRRHAETILEISQMLASSRQANVEPSGGTKNHPVNEMNQQSVGIQRPADKVITDQPLDQVLCSNFWLLSAAENDPSIASAWYKPDGSSLPVVNAMKQFASQQKAALDQDKAVPDPAIYLPYESANQHPIEHYLLLPMYAWGVAEWDLEAIRPFLQEFHPTMGFSVYEARLAQRVTIFGDPERISKDALTILQKAGCQVDRIGLDGTQLAL
jgi:hypothetical protein